MDAAMGDAGRPVTVRLVGVVTQPSVNVVTAPSGAVVALPGQNGVVGGVRLGDRAGGWASDHLEPGVSLRHPDPAADRALQQLACVGNLATVLDGPAAGARGIVFGKHGALLVMLDRAAMASIAPGERVAIEACGVGQVVADEPDVAVHSCSPELLERLLERRGDDGRLLERRGDDGRLRVPVRAILPPEASGAGIGMSAARFDIDVLVDEPPVAELAADLRFGDVVALLDQDHRWVRTPRPGWVAIGVMCHGRSVGGGHGFGLVTLLSGPADRLALDLAPDARLDRLIPMPWEGVR